MKQKILFLDLDGTLLNDRKEITAGNRRAIREALGKARSIHAGLEWIARRIGGAPADPAYPVAYGHSNSPDRVPVCMEALKDVLPQDRPAVMGSIGAVIGTHVGPGAVGVAYILLLKNNLEKRCRKW